jgi:heat shock protein HslJ
MAPQRAMRLMSTAVLLLACPGFTQTPARSEAPKLGGTSWQLLKFQSGDGSTLTPDDQSKYTIAFQTNGRMSMRIDCNRGTGTWKSEKPNQLEFGPLALTRAMCPPDPLNDRIVKDWLNVRSYTVKDGHLFLSLMADGGIYEFGPVNPGEKAGKQIDNPQRKSESPNARAPQTQRDSTYAILRPEQKRLIDAYVRRYSATAGQRIVPQEAYDDARISLRTTFDAVTHALLRVNLTDAKGKSLGRALDVVDAVDEVMGEEAHVGGDRQFRLYVYLKPTAFDTLSKSREFFRDHDNTVYHKGFPTCYRLKNGPPAIQFSISRDKRMADIDVDYRSSSFPVALFNGHLTSSNSDVRAGNNLQRHDDRWAGLNGWWRDAFGFLGSSRQPPEEEAVQGTRQIPLNPAVKANEGIDKSAHDFLKTWVVDKQPNNSVAYFSRRSYPCLEAMAKKDQKAIAPGMVRLRAELNMKKFSDSIGRVTSVDNVFEPANNWSQKLKEAKNAYANEFRLVTVPADMGQDEECVPVPDDERGKQSREKFYATAFRGKKGDTHNKVMSLLWAQEGGYWKIVAVRIEDSNDADIVPTKPARRSESAEVGPKIIAGDPGAMKDITEFYRLWLDKRDTAQASMFASQRSYTCLGTPSAAEKNLTFNSQIRAGLERPLNRIPKRANLSEMMSGVQPANELLRPVEHENSKAFAIMAVPNQKADSFLCQNRYLSEKTPELKPSDAQYGAFYLSASRLNYGEEESPALLLLWTKEKSSWKVAAWAVEVP